MIDGLHRGPLQGLWAADGRDVSETSIVANDCVEDYCSGDVRSLCGERVFRSHFVEEHALSDFAGEVYHAGHNPGIGRRSEVRFGAEKLDGLYVQG